MRKIVFAALAELPLLLGAGAATAGSIKEDMGASMYQNQNPLPNALENAGPGIGTPRLFDGGSAFVDPQAYYNAPPDVLPSAQGHGAPLVGRDWRQGDNF